MNASKRFRSLLKVIKFLLILIISFGFSIVLNSDSLHHKAASIAQEPIPQVSPSPLPQLPKLGASIAVPVKPKLGHFPYPQADPKTLITVGRYGSRIEQLAPEAAIAWKKMVNAAREDNVWIIPISGFRSIETQTQLFYGRVRRWGSQEAAAKVIAPPGYSEHHTGYVIDLGDGRARNLDITTAFARSRVYRWLQKHGQEFGFELSFPQNNFQKISYEPWHWRFVGSPEAEKLFAAARPHATPSIPLLPLNQRNPLQTPLPRN